MDKLEPPQSISFEENVSNGWKLWLKNFEFYLTVAEKDGKMIPLKLQLYCLV